MYRLFHEFAHRYDLHTPPGHYKHDHAYVIREAQRLAPPHCRLLDVGCGTGVFLEAALEAGIDGYGIDAAPAMIDVARRRLGDDRVRVQRMQDISADKEYDVVCALSWTIHYCDTEAQLVDVLSRLRAALRIGGHLILQVANDERMYGAVGIDREAGPAGEPDDTIFIHRFQPSIDAEHCAAADYVYASRCYHELFAERHVLHFAHPSLIAAAVHAAGFSEVSVVDSDSVSPFVVSRAVNP
jgi:2-polyprenyl-3-methyl-5-hydroxy-6-metoxy-1,4-benzoquinol methylase